MVIIEFNGLPGCGKSTFSRELIGKLKESPGDVLSSEDFATADNKKVFMIKALKYKAGRRYLLEVFKILIKTNLLFTADVAKRMIYCMAFIGYYFSLRQTKGYLIMDEGIIQGFVSALFNYNQITPDFSGLVDSLHDLHILFAHIDISPEVASERIAKRSSTGHGRCDDIDDDDERKQILWHQFHNFEAINSVIKEKEKYIHIENKEDLQDLTDAV